MDYSGSSEPGVADEGSGELRESGGDGFRTLDLREWIFVMLVTVATILTTAWIARRKRKLPTNSPETKLLSTSGDQKLESDPMNFPDDHLQKNILVNGSSDSENGQQVEPESVTFSKDRLLNCSIRTFGSEYDSLLDALGSREQRVAPLMNSSWLENVNKYTEREGDSLLFASQDSLEGINWSSTDGCRPESPLQFDHEELLCINEADEKISGQDKIDGHSNVISGECGDDPSLLKYSKSNVSIEADDKKKFKLYDSEADDKKSVDHMSDYKNRDQKDEWKKLCERLSAEKMTLLQQINRQQKSHDEMKNVISEYEKTIQKLIITKASLSTDGDDSFNEIVKEKDQAVEDLQSVESAFSDLHRRYEKSKMALEAYKKNEETLKNCVSEYQDKLKKQEEKYQMLKLHAEEKLEIANKEIGRLKKASESESMVLNAALKKAELHAGSLVQALEQKSREVQELTSICDELISKVGSR